MANRGEKISPWNTKSGKCRVHARATCALIFVHAFLFHVYPPFFNYLAVEGDTVVEDQDNQDEEKPSEEVKTPPPSARRLQIFVQHIRELLGHLVEEITRKHK